MKFTALLAVLMVGLLPHCTYSAQTSEWQVNLTRGSSNTFVRLYKAATKDEAERLCAAGVPASATPSITYMCSAARQVFVVTPDVVVPPPPPPPPPPVPTNSLLMSWTPPTTNSDGSALTNLAGYFVRCGRTATAPVIPIMITVPAATSWRVTNLASGTWHCAVWAFNNEGVESGPSAFKVATVQ